MREQELRKALVEYGNALVAAGLVQGTWGNLSVRLDEKYMLATPSGVDYARLTPEDMVKVDIASLKHEGKLQPTSEKDLHAAIYLGRPEVKGVIHTHAKYSSVFAAANKDMPVLDQYKEMLGDVIKCAKYAFPGTKDLMKNTVEAVGENCGAIMANHGMIACGESLEDAFEKCVKIEENGQKYLLTL